MGFQPRGVGISTPVLYFYRRECLVLSATGACGHHVPVMVRVCAFQTWIATLLLSGRRGTFSALPVGVHLSFPKIPSGLDSHRKAESSHH
jgi:hypothetical protein